MQITLIAISHTARIIPTLFSMEMRAFLFLFLSLCISQQVVAQIDAEMVTIMGRNALSVDDYLTAIRYFNQTIEAKPFLSRPYYYRAYAKFTLEDYTGAEADCTKSIELNPFIVEVYQLRGLCRVHNNDYQGATTDYSRVLDELPEDQGSRYNRALCYLQLKNYAKADSDLNALLKRYPNYYRTYLVKAQSYFEQKDTAEGIRWIDSLLIKNPKEVAAWRFKGGYAMQKEEYQLADSCLSRAITLQPTDFELYVTRAQARHALGKFGLAIADYDRTIELQPAHFVAHYNRGLLRSFTGDLNRAIEDFDYIIKIEPDNTLALYNRAQLRAQTGNYRGAIADYTRLIKAYPNFYAGYLARAECKRKIGDTNGAAADETIVARRNLDIAWGKARLKSKRKVRLRSEHALDQYQQLVQEDPDTVRNVFGTLYGKVQNEKTDDDLLPMYAPAFRPTFTRGYHSIGFMPEMAKLIHSNSPQRRFCLTAESDPSSAQDAEADALRIEKAASSCTLSELSLVRSAVATARYDYTSALDEANRALQADSVSVLALMQRASVLSRSVASATIEAAEAKGRMALATSDLKRAAHLAADNAYIPYNLGCIQAQQGNIEMAIESFTLAIKIDSKLPEAWYNRALLYRRKGEKEKAASDFSRAGQLGLYKAYAQLKQIQQENPKL